MKLPFDPKAFVEGPALTPPATHFLDKVAETISSTEDKVKGLGSLAKKDKVEKTDLAFTLGFSIVSVETKNVVSSDMPVPKSATFPASVNDYTFTPTISLDRKGNKSFYICNATLCFTTLASGLSITRAIVLDQDNNVLVLSDFLQTNYQSGKFRYIGRFAFLTSETTTAIRIGYYNSNSATTVATVSPPDAFDTSANTITLIEIERA